MAKIKVVGNAVVLESEIKFEDIKKVEKYRPDALTMKDEDGKPVFRVATGVNPSANEISVVFNGSTHDDEKHATCTWIVNSGIGEGFKSELADMYGAAILKLNKFEEMLPGIVEEIGKEREAVLSTITLA